MKKYKELPNKLNTLNVNEYVAGEAPKSILV